MGFETSKELQYNYKEIAKIGFWNHSTHSANLIVSMHKPIKRKFNDTIKHQIFNGRCISK